MEQGRPTWHTHLPELCASLPGGCRLHHHVEEKEKEKEVQSLKIQAYKYPLTEPTRI